jgi:hypothetical protein
LRALSADQWRSIVASIVLVPVVQLSLRLRGFTRTAGRLQRWSHRRAVAARPDDARPVAEAVAIVAGRRVLGARCLARSMVLWFLLRRRGIDAELRIGADLVDGVLAAHAWVEVENEPVNDDLEVGTRYGTLGVALPRLQRVAVEP